MKIIQNVSTSILALFMVLSQSAIFAHDEQACVFDKILQNEAFCVKGYDSDKIYLAPEVIHTTEAGIFIEVQEKEFVTVLFLLGDSLGCYVPMNTGIEIFNKCPLCGRTYFIKCKNPECSSNK